VEESFEEEVRLFAEEAMPAFMQAYPERRLLITFFIPRRCVKYVKTTERFSQLL
jgi:hypothetical protein